MSNLPLRQGQVLTGALFNEPVRVETVQANGPETLVVGLQTERFRRVTLTAPDLVARFPWNEVQRVAHYCLTVNALTQPMQVREPTKPCGRSK